MGNNDDLTRRALERVAMSSDPQALRRMAENAKQLGNDIVRAAALRKLFSVSPDADPGTLEHDVWQSIYALENALTAERGKTTRLNRTRQKIARDGELQTVEALILKPPAEGYRMLIDRGWSELTFEAVALRHSHRFNQAVLASAKNRLDESSR